MKKSILIIFIFTTTFVWSQKGQFYYDHAKIHYDMVEYDKALEDVNKALEKSKNYYEAYLLRAQIYYDLNQTSKALEELDQIIASFATADHAHFQKGMIFYDDANYEEAIIHFDKAVELYNHDPEYFYYQGDTYKYLQKMSEACTAWDYGQKEEGKHCEKAFGKNCDGVPLIVPEVPKVSNPFKRLGKKK